MICISNLSSQEFQFYAMRSCCDNSAFAGTCRTCVVRPISLGYQCCDGHAGNTTSILTIDRYLASTVRSHPHKLKGGKTYTVANCDQSKNKEPIKDDFGSGFQAEKTVSCLLFLVSNISTYPTQYILIQ